MTYSIQTLLRSRRIAQRVRRHRYGLIALLTALVLLLSAMPAVGQKSAYPPFLDPHINDYGQILEVDDAMLLRSSLSQFQAQSGVQVVVVTINSVSDYRTGDRTIESFATNLFNTWGIGNRTRNDGILILVATGDRNVRIELGAGYPARADAIASSIIAESMLPYFRDGRISQGIVAGANAVMGQFSRGVVTPTARQSDEPETFLTPDRWFDILERHTPLKRQHIAIGAYGGSVVALLLSVPLGKRLWRYRRRRCPQCQTALVLLNQQQEKQYLQAWQLKEENLNSVTHDVWHCPSCDFHLVSSYRNLHSNFKDCPECRHRTLKQHFRVIKNATHTQSGAVEVTQTCLHCSHHSTHHETTPPIPREDLSTSNSTSSSSSDRSHGGGSSSGGGATSSW